MPLDANGPAPYGPFAPLMQVIGRYRDRGLQVPFTREVLARAGVSDSLVPRVLQTLKLLELIDHEGNPAPVLVDYARASDDDAKALLKRVVEQAYAPVFAFVDPATDSPDRIRDAFRSYEPRGQQERMVALFLGLCEHVGLAPETPRRPTGPRPPRPKNQKPDAAGASGRSGRKPEPEKADPPAGAVPAGLPAAVEGLVRELAAIGPTWTRSRRDQFMNVLGAVIDFSFPVHEPGSGEP